MDTATVIAYYPFASLVERVEPLMTGHINDTFLVYMKGKKEPDYVLQRMNDSVFKEIPYILENIVTADRFFSSSGNEGMIWPALVKTLSGILFLKDEDGRYWRCYEYIRDTLAYERPVDRSMAAEAGRLIGTFHRIFNGMADPLKVTIPRFHDFPYRWEQFERSLHVDFENRAAGTKDLIDFAHKHCNLMSNYFFSFEVKKVPLRPVHYDTKFNNILFDGRGKALALIDLDTLMPGYIQFDYGDALRTLACSAPEDEPELHKVDFDIPHFKAFSAAYFNEIRQIATKEETSLFTLAPIYLTFLIGLRFLTDHLNGDVYFRVAEPMHNRIRARNQFRLADMMLAKKRMIEDTVISCLA